MDNPREVGTDRILNALAAATTYGGPAIVVDFGGTATTFDVVSAQGQYVGGAIAPGIEISLEALGRRGAQLRKVELLRPRSVIAKNTVEALQSGMVFGVASQVEGIVARMIDELGVPSRRRARDRDRLPRPAGARRVPLFHRPLPWLTLRGLELVFARNAEVDLRDSSIEFARLSLRGLHGMSGSSSDADPMAEKATTWHRGCNIVLVDDIDGVRGDRDGLLRPRRHDVRDRPERQERRRAARRAGRLRRPRPQGRRARPGAAAGRATADGPSAARDPRLGPLQRLEVPDRGRVSAEVREAFDAAH